MIGFLFGGKPSLPGTPGTRSYKTATQNKADGPPGPQVINTKQSVGIRKVLYRKEVASFQHVFTWNLQNQADIGKICGVWTFFFLQGQENSGSKKTGP